MSTKSSSQPPESTPTTTLAPPLTTTEMEAETDPDPATATTPPKSTPTPPPVLELSVTPPKAATATTMSQQQQPVLEQQLVFAKKSVPSETTPIAGTAPASAPTITGRKRSLSLANTSNIETKIKKRSTSVTIDEEDEEEEGAGEGEESIESKEEEFDKAPPTSPLGTPPTPPTLLATPTPAVAAATIKTTSAPPLQQQQQRKINGKKKLRSSLKPVRKSTSPRAATATAQVATQPKSQQPRPKSMSEDSLVNAVPIPASHDQYCWICHKQETYFYCKSCPRSFHKKCIPEIIPSTTVNEGQSGENQQKIICPECNLTMKSENVLTRSEQMKKINLVDFYKMLKYATNRMKSTIVGVDPFLLPVNKLDAEDYDEYIIYPMDIQTLENNISLKLYGSTQAFLADARWILHNSIIFNSASSPYTAVAKKIMKITSQEVYEIETCSECYQNAHEDLENWFIDGCSTPHVIVWAKLKGFPYWPAKAMRIKDDQVDVRFFGQHDKAWVERKDCFLYSEKIPTEKLPSGKSSKSTATTPTSNKKGQGVATPGKKSNLFLQSMAELAKHIESLEEKYGTFVMAEFKTPLVSVGVETLQKMLPEYVPTPLTSAIQTVKKLEEADDDDDEPRDKPTSATIDTTITIKGAKPTDKIEDMEIDEEAPTTTAPLATPANVLASPQIAAAAATTLLATPQIATSVLATPQIAAAAAASTSALAAPTKIATPAPTPSTTQQIYKISNDFSISKLNPTGLALTRPPISVGQNKYIIKDGNIREISTGGTAASAVVNRFKYQQQSGGGNSSPSATNAITLPGGNITVTPIIVGCSGGSGGVQVQQSKQNGDCSGGGGVAVTQLQQPQVSISHHQQRHQQSGVRSSSAPSMSAASSSNSSSGSSGSSSSGKKIVSIQLPQNIAGKVANCTSAIKDILKKTIEQISIDIIENMEAEQAAAAAAKDGNSNKENDIKLKELEDFKHNYELQLAELQTNHEIELKKLKLDMKKLEQKYETDMAKAIEATKKKQWCSGCGREALFYCCWNTSYCGYECQETHWPNHMINCTQGQQQQGQVQGGGGARG